MPRAYRYGITSHNVWTEELTGTSDPNEASPPRLIKTTLDPLGRTKYEERAAYPTSTVTTEHHYNALGQLAKVTVSSGLAAPTLYEYDLMGNLIATGLDLDTNDTLDRSGDDRIDETITIYEEDGSEHWWRKTHHYVYAAYDDPNATVVGTVEERLTGFSSGLIRETKSIDARDNATVSQTVIDRGTTEMFETVNYPNTTNNAERVSLNGLLVSLTDTAGVTTSYGYDALGRRTSAKQARHANATVTTFNAYGQVDYVTDPQSVVTDYNYSATTGRLEWVKNGDNKYTRYGYDDHGRVVKVWGDVPQPSFTRYDVLGQRVQLWTFRDPNAAWSGSTWPADPNDPNGADITAWAFHDATGLVTSKTDAAGKAVSYTYLPDGRPLTRTWARGPERPRRDDLRLSRRRRRDAENQ